MTVALSSRPEMLAPRAPQTGFALPLESPGDVELVGEKAHALGRMLRAGIAVPGGVVLTGDAFRAHLAENEIDDDDAHAGALVRSAPIPIRVQVDLATLAEPLLAFGPVVVRSSAVGEDGPGASFAGQLDSVLHVTDQESLERAVRAVWSSYWSERALFYRRARKVAARGMGVVVQRQVDAQAAGVLFTATAGGDMLVEYAPGLADALVGGAVDPGRVAIDRRSGAVRRLARHEAFTLDARYAAELRAVGLELEREFGAPQDVEWTIAGDGTLFIVQSRPITTPVTISSARPAPRPPATPRRISWSNANVNENFPRPISPLLFSIATAGYRHYFRNLAVAFGVSPRRVAAMESAFSQIIGTHGARMYYNLTSIHSVLRLAPFGRTLTASFDTFVGADGDGVIAETAESASRVGQMLEVAVIVAKAARLFTEIDGRIARFERTVDEFAARTAPSRLDAMSLADLGAALAGFMEIRCDRWLDASLADAAAMLCYGALERLLCRAFGPGAVHTSLLKAIPNVVSGEPVLRLWNLSRLVRANPALHALIETTSPSATLDAIRTDARFTDFRTALQSYLDDWGFRCSEELMLTSPSFQEQPEPLIELLRSYARVETGSPRDALRAQAAERERETRRVLSDLTPAYAAMLEALLPRTHAAIRYRERARLKQALLYSRCRRIALAMGAELARRDVIEARDDVFFLSHTELAELSASDAAASRTARALVSDRKAEHTRLAALNPPDAFTLAEGEAYDFNSMIAEDRRPTTDGLLGTPACGGKITGRATVLSSVTESAKLAQGDVLVTKQTDPGWGPVFFLISGLVIERGGMLSHGAIIAREFGIPCVVGVQRAMERIPTGATVAVDGDTGVVHVLD